jgi:hypothetical protein
MKPVPQWLLRLLRSITSPEQEQIKSSHPHHLAHIHQVRKVLQDPNFIGIGIARKEVKGKKTTQRCICFYFEQKVPSKRVAAKFLVPPVLASAEGRAAYTDVKVLGRIRPARLVQNVKLQSGYSVGHVSGDTGTVGAIVARGDARFILSASHVLARCGLATVGDHILYPGRVDQGVDEANWVASLTQAYPLTPGTDLINIMDAAIAQIRPGRIGNIVPSVVGGATPLQVGPVRETMAVTLTGLVSGTTSGETDDCHFSFIMRYDDIGDTGFSEQVLCTNAFTQDGDSGALVLDAVTGRVVGLHMGLSKSGQSIFSPIGPIMEKLNINFL